MQISDISRSQVEEVRVDFTYENADGETREGVITITAWPMDDGFTVYSSPWNKEIKTFYLIREEAEALLAALDFIGVKKGA